MKLISFLIPIMKKEKMISYQEQKDNRILREKLNYKSSTI